MKFDTPATTNPIDQLRDLNQARLGQRRHVILMGVNAARGQQAQEMRGSAARLDLLGEIQQRGIAGEFAALHRPIDARQVLQHDASGADIHVPDFGIAHLAFR